MILHCLSPVLEAIRVPDITQTAYQKGLSCVDAIFATQEALLVHARDGGRPLVGLYDMEKPFDSVESPIVLEEIYSVGVNGKFWRLLKSWYSTATARVRVDSCFSEKFSISCGVKQGSVLSPTLFLVFMDKLAHSLRDSSEGLSVKGLCMGAALHADDLQISAPSIECLSRQDKVIYHFTAEFKLNQEKLEIVKISTTNRKEEDCDTMKVGSIEITPSDNARCLGVMLNPRLTARDSFFVRTSKNLKGHSLL